MKNYSKNNNYKIICVIPARGGSKGIPLKNMKEIDGISLVGRASKTSSNCTLVEKTYVSSDNEKILAEGKRYLAEPLMRSSINSRDDSTTEDALFDAILKLEEKKIIPEIIVYIQCTSPFIKSSDIDNAIRILKNNKDIDTVFSAVKTHAFLWEVKNNLGYGVNHNAYEQRLRRQDLPNSYREDGSFYVFRLNRFKKTKNRFGTSALPYINSINMPFEIDDLNELEMARALSPFFKNIF